MKDETYKKNAEKMMELIEKTTYTNCHDYMNAYLRSGKGGTVLKELWENYQEQVKKEVKDEI